MTYTVLSVLTLFAYFTLHVQRAPANNKDLICWQENRRLSWKDFQAPVSKQEKELGALSVIQLFIHGTTTSEGEHKLVVSVVFNQKEAWVRDSTSLLAAELLQHEQLHFDIGELVARKLRARIAQVYQAGGDVLSPLFIKEVADFRVEFSQLEKLYDRETDHGTVVAEQKKWTARVRSELVKLNLYKSTSDICMMK